MSIPLHVVVTGASAGIGAGIARAYARAGARLSLVARRGAPMQALLDETGATGRVFEADLATPERSTVWLADAIAAFGEPDVLVNNAGAQVVGHTAAGDPDDGERTLRLNVFTPLRLIRAVLPGMLRGAVPAPRPPGVNPGGAHPRGTRCARGVALRRAMARRVRLVARAGRVACARARSSPPPAGSESAAGPHPQGTRYARGVRLDARHLDRG
jgi:NAD(P)-dependent dehydrogenase (short-subunit alcohol dehydrogenase family)